MCPREWVQGSQEKEKEGGKISVLQGINAFVSIQEPAGCVGRSRLRTVLNCPMLLATVGLMFISRNHSSDHNEAVFICNLV
jgi:hypothetical protein